MLGLGRVVAVGSEFRVVQGFIEVAIFWRVGSVLFAEVHIDRGVVVVNHAYVRLILLL